MLLIILLVLNVDIYVYHRRFLEIALSDFTWLFGAYFALLR